MVARQKSMERNAAPLLAFFFAVPTRLAVLASTLLLAACAASPPPSRISSSELEKSRGVSVQDLRPAEEKKPETFSYLVSSERYGIYRLGDISTSPSALRLLQHSAYERLSANGAIEIKVHHLAAYQNLQSMFRAGVLGTMRSYIAAGIASNDVEFSVRTAEPAEFAATSGDKEWKRGTNTEEENLSHGTSLTLWLDVEINGKRVMVHAVGPMKEFADPNQYMAALESSYSFLLQQF